MYSPVPVALQDIYKNGKKYGIVCTPLFLLNAHFEIFWLWIILGCLLHWHCQYYLRYISLHKHIASTAYYTQLGIKKETFNPKSEARSRGLIPNQMKLGSPIRTNVQILRNKYWSSWVLRRLQILKRSPISFIWSDLLL